MGYPTTSLVEDSSVIGHVAVREFLEESNFQAYLLVGPSSVGKWTLAEHLSVVWGVVPPDVIRIHVLDVEAARDVDRISRTLPIGKLRVFIIRLDESSSDAKNILLKSLEEKGGPNRFILTSSELPSEATIVSRCMVFKFSLLSEENVETILKRKNFRPELAKTLAAISGGQVSVALSYAYDRDLKMTVLSAYRAIRERDEDALDQIALNWKDSHTSLLSTLCHEMITNRWRVFDSAEPEIVNKTLALRILRSLAQDVRPRLVVRSNLMGVLRNSR